MPVKFWFRTTNDVAPAHAAMQQVFSVPDPRDVLNQLRQKTMLVWYRRALRIRRSFELGTPCWMR